MKESFILYNSFYEPIKALKNEQLGKLLRAIFDYTINGEITQDDEILVAFMFIKNQIDIDTEKWQEEKAKRSKAGRLGGIQRAINKGQNLSSNAKQCLKVLSNAKQSQANQADNVNVNENDNDNENVNVNVSVNENAPSGYSGKDTTTQSETQTTTGVWPTIGTIKTYCAEQGIETDVAKFYQYNLKRRFDRDWKEALTLWVGHDRQDPEPKKKPNSFNDNFPARKYDYDELEKRLLQVKGT